MQIIKTNIFSVESEGGYFYIKFVDKPSENIRLALKSYRYKWDNGLKLWYGKASSNLTDYLSKELLPKLPDGNCWKCGSDQGYFRSLGAATPVWCDDCYIEEKNARPKYQ